MISSAENYKALVLEVYLFDHHTLFEKITSKERKRDDNESNKKHLVSNILRVFRIWAYK